MAAVDGFERDSIQRAYEEGDRIHMEIAAKFREYTESAEGETTEQKQEAVFKRASEGADEISYEQLDKFFRESIMGAQDP